jgi:hypothetical protein
MDFPKGRKHAAGHRERTAKVVPLHSNPDICALYLPYLRNLLLYFPFTPKRIFLEISATIAL